MTVMSIIGAAAVFSLICIHYYGSEEIISNLDEQYPDRELLTEHSTMNDVRNPLLSAVEQQHYNLAEVGNNLKEVQWNTSLDTRTASTSGLYVVHIPYVNVPGVDCPALFSGSIPEIIQARVHQQKWPKQTISDDIYVAAAADCEQYITWRRFIMWPLSNEEATFPLAFSIVMFRDVEHFERLLRAVYRPQNIYCVHVDEKSVSTVHKAVAAITACFNNVFIAPQRVHVYWGTYSVLEPELICMKALLSYSKKWQYFINLAGQEFPLKTNWEIVKILKVLDGANNIEGTVKRLLLCCCT